MEGISPEESSVKALLGYGSYKLTLDNLAEDASCCHVRLLCKTFCVLDRDHLTRFASPQCYIELLEGSKKRSK